MVAWRAWYQAGPVRIDRVVRTYSRRRRSRAGPHGHGRRQARQSHDGRRGWWSAPGSVTIGRAGGNGFPARGSAGVQESSCASGRPRPCDAAAGCTARAACVPAVRASPRRGRAPRPCRRRIPSTTGGAIGDKAHEQGFGRVSCRPPGLVPDVVRADAAGTSSLDHMPHLPGSAGARYADVRHTMSVVTALAVGNDGHAPWAARDPADRLGRRLEGVRRTTPAHRYRTRFPRVRPDGFVDADPEPGGVTGMSDRSSPVRCASLLRREAPQRRWTLAQLPVSSEMNTTFAVACHCYQQTRWHDALDWPANIDGRPVLMPHAWVAVRRASGWLQRSRGTAHLYRRAGHRGGNRLLAG